MWEFYEVPAAGMDLDTWLTMFHDYDNELGFWDEEPWYDIRYPEFSEPWYEYSTVMDGYRALEIAAAQVMFGIADEDMDSFWEHYICDCTDMDTMPEWTATTVFND